METISPHCCITWRDPYSCGERTMHKCFWREDKDEDAVLVLEFLGSDLRVVIREGKRREGGLGVGEVKRWMIEVLRGVDEVHTHRKGIVHRDLKPKNLLIGAGGRAGQARPFRPGTMRSCSQ